MNGTVELVVVAANYSSYNNQSCIIQNVEVGEFLFMGFGVFLICFLGILGNFLSALVLVKSPLKSSVNLLLLGLTFCDTIVILFSIATFALPTTIGYFQFAKGYNYYWFPFIAPYLLPIALIGQTGSVYFTVAITIERYVVVCWPLYAKFWCTNRRARVYTVAVFLFSVLFNLTRWFELRVILPTTTTQGGRVKQRRHAAAGHSKSPNTTNHMEERVFNCYSLVQTDLRNDADYTYYYVNWLYMVFMYVIPFLILAVLNTSIYKHIKWANKSRRRMTLSRSQSRENSIAQMLVSVVIVFLLCNVLAMVNNALESFWSTSILILMHLSNFLVTFNSCCNFAIYYIFGQKFRKSFIGVWNEFFPCCQISFKPINGAATNRSVRTELEPISK